MQFPPEMIDRFWSKVEKTDDCWTWAGCKRDTKDGYLAYGYFHFGRHRWMAHRFSWTLANGDIPRGLVVCHHCDNAPCVRPDHLFVGTIADNNADGKAKGRFDRLKPENDRVRLVETALLSGITQRTLAARFGIGRDQLETFIEKQVRQAALREFENLAAGREVF